MSPQRRLEGIGSPTRGCNPVLVLRCAVLVAECTADVDTGTSLTLALNARADTLRAPMAGPAQGFASP